MMNRTLTRSSASTQKVPVRCTRKTPVVMAARHVQHRTSTARSAASSSFVGGQRILVARPSVRHATTQQRGRARASTVTVEANLFSRAFRIIKAYVDQLVGSFEDPEKLLDRVTDEMTQDAIKMRQASAQAIASQRQMAARAQNMQAAADQWLRRAELAVKTNQDDLAREALARRKAIQADADRMMQQAAQQQQACDQLSAAVRTLESKITEARNKKETLKARAASAKSSLAIQEMIGGLRSTSSSSFAAFEKMEEKVMAVEAEAQSMAALSTPDSLESRFEMLESGGVEAELAALKAGQVSQRMLERPKMSDVLQRAPRDAIDLELEELRRKARA